MGLPNKDEIKGKYDQATGTVKKKVGQVIDDPEMVEEGQNQKDQGEVKEGFGKARRKVGETVEDLGRKIKR